METITVAVPTMAPGGLDAGLDAHFGHCQCYTLVDVMPDSVGNVRVIDNVPHEQGGCMVPVNLLAANKVNALVAGGMGMRPLQGFGQVGIAVFHNMGLATAGQAVEAFAEGKLPRFGQEHTCGGGDDHHHHG